MQHSQYYHTVWIPLYRSINTITIPITKLLFLYTFLACQLLPNEENKIRISGLLAPGLGHSNLGGCHLRPLLHSSAPLLDCILAKREKHSASLVPWTSFWCHSYRFLLSFNFLTLGSVGEDFVPTTLQHLISASWFPLKRPFTLFLSFSMVSLSHLPRSHLYINHHKINYSVSIRVTWGRRLIGCGKGTSGSV